MGAVVGQLEHDDGTPWVMQVIIDNTCHTSLKVFLCNDPECPKKSNAVEHIVPANQTFAIHYRWRKEPRAAILMRTSMYEAQVFNMAHAARLKVGLAPDGFSVNSNDDVLVEPYPNAGSVPNNDTVPMIMRRKSFADVKATPEVMQRDVDLGDLNSVYSDFEDNRNIFGRVSSFADKSPRPLSPCSTQVILIENACATPVKIFQCHDSEYPSVKDSIQHNVPAKSTYALNARTWWSVDPCATLLVRVGLRDAQVFRVPHAAQLRVDVAPRGLKVTSADDISVEPYYDPASVPNHDTVPMRSVRMSFKDTDHEENFGVLEWGSPKLPQQVESPLRFFTPGESPVARLFNGNALRSPVANLFGSPSSKSSVVDEVFCIDDEDDEIFVIDEPLSE